MPYRAAGASHPWRTLGTAPHTNATIDARRRLRPATCHSTRTEAISARLNLKYETHAAALCCQNHPEQSEPGRHRTKRRGAHERQNSPTDAIQHQARAAHRFRPSTPRTDNVHYVISAAGTALPTELLS